MPFSCQLCLHCDDETRERAVGLPETFVYLLGPVVQMHRSDENGERRYLVYRGVLRTRRTAVVIWRGAKDRANEDDERGRNVVAEQNLTDGVDVVFVTGDSRIFGAPSLDPIFRARIAAAVDG